MKRIIVSRQLWGSHSRESGNLKGCDDRSPIKAFGDDGVSPFIGWLRITIYLFIFILFFNAVSFAYESSKETELLFMAKKAYEDGFYEVSLGMLERFRNDFSASIQLKQARLLSGQCYFQQGRYLEALNIFEELINDPQCASFKDAIYFWMAEVHFKGNNFDNAALLYRKLIDDFPLSSYAASAYYSLGWSLSQTGKYDQALQVFNSLLEKFPTEPQSKDAAFKLIECLYNLKKYSELENKVKSVLNLYNNDRLRLPYLYFYLAESQYYLENFNEAVKNYLKSVQAFKEQKAQVLAKLGLGWSYLKLSKYKEAEDVFGDIKYGSLDKKSLDIFILGQAVLMNQTNRVYEAKKLYEQLINISSDPLMRMQAYLGKADALYNLAEYNHAADVYKEGLDKVDNSAVPDELMNRIRNNLALAYIKGGQVSSAISIFGDLLGKSDDQVANVKILFQIGDAYREEGEFVKAQEAYMKILKLYPDSNYIDYAQYQIGVLKLKRADYNGAIITFESILKKYPQSSFLVDTFYSLGTAYFQKTDYQKSFEIFSKFKSQFKDSVLVPQALYMLGNSLLNLGRTNEASSVFKDALKLTFTDIELRQKVEYEIADCYYKLGQEDEALKSFKLLRTKYPDSKLLPDILWWLGQYYYRSGDLVLAQRYFNSLIKDFSDNRLAADAFYAMGLIFSAQDKPEQAADNFKKALELGGTDLRAQAQMALAKVYYRLQDYEKAKLYYTKILEGTNILDEAGIRFNLAEVLENNSEFDAAIQQYLLAVDLNKQDTHLSVLALLRVAKLYEDKENFKEALQMYKRVIQKDTQEAKFAQERVDWINSSR
ncbi:MAG: tetratricopeptide repeat protein [Candidatus Omnitrophota bacterium]|nr:tetratricopeptide repeat protein [Candidatus Omnitrophota bacterium]